jgi:CBS domain-containing protein
VIPFTANHPFFTEHGRGETEMLVKDIMSEPVIACTPWDTAQTAATLMNTHAIGAVPVVSDVLDPLFAGIVTDRDLMRCHCRQRRACGQNSRCRRDDRVPITCLPETSMEECLELTRNCQVRRVLVVDQRDRCVGIVSQADSARYASSEEIALALREVSSVPRPCVAAPVDENYFYCGRLHELDQIALLERRRQQAATQEVLT